MGLIKSTNAPAAATPFSMKDIEGQARAMLVRAREQAEHLLAEAQIEAEALKAAAHTDGFKEGHATGLAQGSEAGRAAGQQQALKEHQAQLSSVLSALLEAVRQLDASRKQLEVGAEAEVIKLAVAIARRVTKKTGEADPAVLSGNIGEAMKLVVHSCDVRIAVNPAQRQTLLAALPQLKLSWPALEHVELMEDATIAPGGCRISTRQGVVDADLDEQIDRIAAELLPQPVAAARASQLQDVPTR